MCHSSARREKTLQTLLPTPWRQPPRGGRVICLGAPPLCCHQAFYHQMSPMPLKGGDINSLNGLLKVTRYKTWSQA